MNRKNKLLLALIAVVILAVGVFFIIKLSRGTVVIYEDTPATNTPPPTSVVETSEPPISTDIPTELDPAIAASMDEIEEQVSQLRGLAIKTSVPRQLMTREELNRVVVDEFLQDYTTEDEQKDIAVMHLFGFLPADFELREFYLDMYTEQIAGYYDIKQKEMFIVSDTGFGGIERLTYAHEYVHALQDAHFDIEGSMGYTDEICAEDSERCIAVQALIEGDASLIQSLWFQNHSTQQDLKDLETYVATSSTAVLDSAPAALQESLTFPYLYGLTFVQALYARDGYDAIDVAFSTMQPVSSEQIMHPSAYPDDLPDNPSLPDLQSALGEGWVEIDNDTLGEWYVYMFLAKAFNPQHRLFDSIAQDAAAGWGGDAYSVLKNEQSGEHAAFVALNWDTEADTDAALKAFRDYSDLRFGAVGSDGVWQGDDYFAALVQTSPTSFVWLVGQNLATIQSLEALVR